MALFFLLCTTFAIHVYVAYVPWGVRFVFTPSIPRGLYLSKTYDQTAITRGQDVCFRPTELAWMAGRDYLYQGEVICKHALGIPGDLVDVRGDELFICHQAVCTSAGKVHPTDSKGRPSTPAFSGKTPIPAGSYYLGSTFHPMSFDSRYLGLIDARALTVRTWAVWTY